MQRGEMYVQYGDLPKKAAIEVLSNFKDVISWKSGCKVLDIGCGPGNITHDIFFPLLPKSTEKVVGVDRCPDYINYAKNHYGKNPVISFQLLDIVNDEVPKEFEEYFDYAVSFLCFHQFSNHEAAFRNINKMLKPGGEILFYFPVTANSFQLYKVLHEQAKWECLRDYEMYCSPYKDSTNPKDDLKILLNKVGYKILSLNTDEKRYKLPLQHVQKLQKTLIPLPVPDDLSEEISKAAVMALRSLNFIGMDENGTEYWDFIYNLAILYAVRT